MFVLLALLSLVSANLVGKKAPDWSEDAVVDGDFKTLSLDDYKGKWLVLFFYPLDFTFVCPTEINSFSDKIQEFKDIGAEVVGVSVDNKYVHHAWIETPREKGGLGGITYPLVADLRKQMARAYDVLIEEEGHTYRGLFIINPDQIIKHITINDPPVGRNVEEVLRLLKGYQFVEQNDGHVCPMNWTPGQDTIKDNPKEKLEYFEKTFKKEEL